MKLTVSHAFLPKQRSLRASLVMDHFGIGFETGRHVIAEDLELPMEPSDVVCFTGESGSGKSSLMRAAARQLSETSRTAQARGPCDSLNDPIIGLTPRCSPVLNLDDLELPDNILVEAIDRPIPETLSLLSSCGLGEAHLLLRTPTELSDGQRYRFRLAYALSMQPDWIIADEFTATLDRTLAKVVAFNIRRLATRTGVGFLIATTHEDVVEDLSPDLHVRCRLDGEIKAESGKPKADSESTSRSDSARFPLSALRSAHGSQPANHNKPCPQSPSSTNSKSRPVKNETGRTSLGGITAATTSESSGG